MTRNPHKPANNRYTSVILVILALCIAGALYLNRQTLTSLISKVPVREVSKEKLNQAPPEPEVAQPSNSRISSPAAQTTPSLREADNSSVDFHNKTCQELDESIQDYFSRLDREDYMARYALKEGSYEHFRQMIASLLANPPIVARETDSLFTILTNTAHFYRILGKDNILMVKDVLLHSGDSLEPTLAMFYQWSISDQECPNATTQIALPLQGLYEYAGFFLNTLGGQAYLFRRETRQRLLIKYYCLLILDRANAGILNRHGINIVPHLESLAREMDVSENLLYKEHYLKTLRDLQDKYQTYYQPNENISPTPEDNQ